MIASTIFIAYCDTDCWGGEMVQDTPSRKLDQYIVRFPDGMRERLKTEAKANGRSLNAEIVYRLEESLAEESGRRAMEAHEESQRPTEEEALRAHEAYEQWLEEQGGRPHEEFPPDDALINAPDDFVPPPSSRQRQILKKLDLSDPEVAAAIVAAMKEAVAETVAAMNQSAATVQEDDES